MRKLNFILLLLIVSSYNVYGYTISNHGKKFIKEHEKCSLISYWDSNGYSIGYGHHTKDVKKNQRISQKQADAFFASDIKKFESTANRLLESLPYKYKFSQGFFDGFVSFTYNCGEGGVRNSEFYKRLKRCRVKNGKMNQNDINYALSAIKKKISAPGHKDRRLNEYKLMSK